MSIRYTPIQTEIVARWRAGQPDAYGLTPERVAASDGGGTPCRHCLAQVPAGRPYLIVAHRPFLGLNPYTETGPLFVCADDCASGGGGDFPADMMPAPSYIVRGYSAEERIIYGTGGVVPVTDIPARCEALFERPEVAFIHIRSAANNCFQCHVDRA